MGAAFRMAAIWAAVALLLSLGSARAAPPQPGDTDLVLERFTVANDGDCLLLPVELKGQTYLFLLDTGASHTCYDVSLRPLLGEPLRTEEVGTAGQTMQIPVFAPPDARLGRLSLRTDAPVMCADLRGLREVSGHPIYGVLGMEFLRQRPFRLDPDRGEVVFLRFVGPDPGRRLPVTMVKNRPYVDVEVAGLPSIPVPGVRGTERFMVDTGDCGASSGDMRPEVFQALQLRGKVRLSAEGLGTSLSGTETERRGRVEAITVAGHRHPDLLFSETGDNLLGLNYWSRYVVTFDFAHGALYLKEGRRYREPDAQGLSGMHFLRTEGRTVVKKVDAGSPAAACGVRAGDELLVLGGCRVAESRLHALRRLLCAEGKQVRVVLRRDGRDLEVALKLADRPLVGAPGPRRQNSPSTSPPAIVERAR